MIASNYRKHPEALALQLPLPFGRALVWALPRPTTRLLRAIRAERARLIAAQPRVQRPAPRSVPDWWRMLRQAGAQLAAKVRAACLTLF